MIVRRRILLEGFGQVEKESNNSLKMSSLDKRKEHRISRINHVQTYMR